MKDFYLFEKEKAMILGVILGLLGIALTVPYLSHVGLFWIPKATLMRYLTEAIIGVGVCVYGAYTFVNKGIYG